MSDTSAAKESDTSGGPKLPPEDSRTPAAEVSDSLFSITPKMAWAKPFQRGVDLKSTVAIMLKVSDIRSRRLDKTQARKLLTKIIHQHPANIRFSRHAFNELEYEVRLLRQ